MSKEIYISSTPQETRLAIVEKDELAEIYYERENEYTLAGSIYNGRVTRVLPGMQSAFVDIGLERDAFLYITDFMEEQGDSADFEGESSRNGRGERSSRAEGRERSEGRERGEGRRRERQPAQATATEEEPIALQGESESSDAGEETGEGSRRWRGRRGRRRGRGDNGDGGPSVEAGGENGDAQAREPREPRDFDRGSERPRRGDRDRGRQDAVRERFAPRGHRHSSTDESIDINASAEPFILPGESLSKYRRGEASERTAEARSSISTETSNSPRPSTEFELTSAWDGGLTLPGESLSRHRGGERSENKTAEPGEFEAAESFSSGSARGRDRRRERDERRGRSGRERSVSPEEAVLPAVTSQHEPEPAARAFSDDVPAFEVAETEARLELERFTAGDVAYTPSTDVAPAEERPSDSVLELVE